MTVDDDGKGFDPDKVETDSVVIISGNGSGWSTHAMI
jgi:signal transduction histidine kinase